METFNVLILDTFPLRRKYKPFKIVAKGSSLWLRLPPARNRKPWETRLPKTHKSWCSRGSLPSHQGRCRGALPSFPQDLIDVETSPTHISIPANQQVQKKKGFDSSRCQHVCRTRYRLLQARSTSKAGYLYTDGADGHKQPSWGFSATWTPRQYAVPKQTGAASYTLLQTRGGLSLAKAAVPNACVHLPR